MFLKLLIIHQNILEFKLETIIGILKATGKFRYNFFFQTVTNCSDGGVVGVVPGIIGSLQAQEAMKIIGEFGQVLSGKLLLYDGLSCRFTSVKLRPRSEKADLIEKLIDYEQFCGAKATDKGGLISGSIIHPLKNVPKH